MIKKYNDYIKESLLDKLKGPTDEEILENDPNLFLTLSLENNDINGVVKAFDYGADISYNNYEFFAYKNSVDNEIIDLLFEYSNLPKTIDEFNNILFNNIKPNNSYFNDITVRYKNDYGVLFYYENYNIEISSEFFYIYKRVYSLEKNDIKKIISEYFDIVCNYLIISNFTSFKLNKLLFDNKHNN